MIYTFYYLEIIKTPTLHIQFKILKYPQFSFFFKKKGSSENKRKSYMNNKYLKNIISDSYYFSFYTTYPKGFYQSLKISIFNHRFPAQFWKHALFRFLYDLVKKILNFCQAKVRWCITWVLHGDLQVERYWGSLRITIPLYPHCVPVIGTPSILHKNRGVRCLRKS